MKTVFIDSSVLLAACISTSGAASRILMLCRKEKLWGYVSHYVLNEVKKNAVQKLDEKGKKRLNFYLLQSRLHKVENPSKESVLECEQVINSKDAPILAAAIKSKATVLVTLDKRDFMTSKVRNHIHPILLFTPDKFLSSLPS